MTEAINLADLARSFWRRKFLLLALAALGAVLVAGLMQLLPRSYTAKGMILVKSNEITVQELQGPFAAPLVDLPLVRSQVDALQSDPLVRRVVEQLELHRDNEFNPAPPAWRSWVRQALGDWVPPPRPDDPVGRAMVGVKRSLVALTDGRSYVVHVEFTSRDPQKSARIVNALLDAYIAEQVEAKQGASQEFNDELVQRVEQLRQKVADAEAKVRAFRGEHGLVETTSGTVAVQQLAELNSELTVVRAERAQAEARYREAVQQARGGGASTIEAVTSQTMRDLRIAEARLVAERAQVAASFVAGHPSLRKIESQLADVRAEIAAEIRRIVQSLGQQAEIARARETDLRRQLRQLEETAAVSADAAERLRALDEEARAQRRIYEAFLARVEQMGRPRSSSRPDASVLARALPPVEPAGPGVATLAVLSGLGSLLLAFGGLIARDHMADAGFRRPEELAAVTGLPSLAAIPSIGDRNQAPARFVVSHPNSAVAETIRWSLAPLLANMEQRRITNGRRAATVLVTSSLPGEGKTTYASSLGRLLARDGKRVLLLECDLRRPGLRRMIGGDQAYHLQDILDEHCALAEGINVDPASGMHFITGRRDPHAPQKVLQSNGFRTLLGEAGRYYDQIIIDSPPVMNVYDPMILAEHADSVVLVVRKGRTPRKVVGETVRRLSSATGATVGAVLMRADSDAWGTGIYNGYN